MGRENTQRSVKQLLPFGVEHLISWGTAAGISQSVREGDLLIPDSVIISGNKYATNKMFNNELLRLLPAGLRWHKGMLYNADELLDTVESKLEIFASTRCLGADMESGALAEAAVENDISFSVIRAVSDPVGQQLPRALKQGFTVNGDFAVNEFVKYVLTNPSDWWAAFSLARNFIKARKTLNIVARVLKDQEWTQPASLN